MCNLNLKLSLLLCNPSVQECAYCTNDVDGDLVADKTRKFMEMKLLVQEKCEILCNRKKHLG